MSDSTWAACTRCAQHVLIALVLWNGLTTGWVWMYGFREASCRWLVSVPHAPGRLIRLSIWPKAADSSAIAIPGIGGSAPGRPVLLVDLWEHNRTSRRVVHLAGRTLARHHLAWLGGSATVAPLPLLVVLARLQRHGQHVSRRRAGKRVGGLVTRWSSEVDERPAGGSRYHPKASCVHSN